MLDPDFSLAHLGLRLKILFISVENGYRTMCNRINNPLLIFTKLYLTKMGMGVWEILDHSSLSWPCMESNFTVLLHFVAILDLRVEFS